MDFPMDPHELPNFAAIYKDDEPVELDETIVLQQRAPALRKSNKTIRPSTVAQAVVPAASAVPNEPSGWMQQMMMFSQFMQQQQQQAQQQGGHEVVHLLQPRGAKRQKALMPPDASDTPTAPAAPPAAQPAASPSAKAGAKAGAKAKAKASGGVKPVVERQKFKGGWVVEVKLRPTGQKDKSYIGPNGKVYRMQHEAESAGFVAKTK